MIAGEFRDLIEALDLNSRYSLRRTADRVNRLHSFLSSTHLDSAVMPPPSTLPPQQPAPTQQQLYMLTQTEQSLLVSRFTGYVPEGHPKRDQLMSRAFLMTF